MGYPNILIKLAKIVARNTDEKIYAYNSFRFYTDSVRRPDRMLLGFSYPKLDKLLRSFGLRFLLKCNHLIFSLIFERISIPIPMQRREHIAHQGRLPLRMITPMRKIVLLIMPPDQNQCYKLHLSL
jgi:hypothetical protein